MTVEDRGAGDGVAVVFGPGADKLAPFGGVTAFVDPRWPKPALRVLAPAGKAAALLAAHGCTQPGPFEAYEGAALGLGVPDGSRDLVVEKALLLE